MSKHKTASFAINKEVKGILKDLSKRDMNISKFIRDALVESYGKLILLNGNEK